MAMAEFTHFDNDGNAHMVDVGSKADTKRIAIVRGHIRMQPETLAMITDGTAKRVMFWGLRGWLASWGQNKPQI